MNADIKRKRIIYNNERRSSSTKRNFLLLLLLLLLTPRRRLLQAPPFASAHTDGIDQRGINQWPKRTFSFFILSGDSIHHCLISKTFFLLLLLLYVPGLWQLKLYIDAKRCFWCVLYVYRFPIFLLYVHVRRKNLQVLILVQFRKPREVVSPIESIKTTTTNPSKRIRAWWYTKIVL